ncbi:hypothetical protein BJ742DRAFT_852601 [Cladochytrium replicatum]|nr:hypothetical protein BJ742DRAFT_852601 [Cladochytrium replicatum]
MLLRISRSVADKADKLESQQQNDQRCSEVLQLTLGVLLGPIGTIQSVIQTETIARGLGIMFTMFFLGVEFNFSNIQKDIILGLMLAVLPVLERFGADVAIARLVLALILFIIVPALLAQYRFQYLLNKVKRHGGRELYLLTVIGIRLVLIEFGGTLGLGTEISCFVA